LVDKTNASFLIPHVQCKLRPTVPLLTGWKLSYDLQKCTYVSDSADRVLLP